MPLIIAEGKWSLPSALIRVNETLEIECVLAISPRSPPPLLLPAAESACHLFGEKLHLDYADRHVAFLF